MEYSEYSIKHVSSYTVGPIKENGRGREKEGQKDPQTITIWPSCVSVDGNRRVRNTFSRTLLKKGYRFSRS